jgi:carboxypeptidase Q
MFLTFRVAGLSILFASALAVAADKPKPAAAPPSTEAAQPAVETIDLAMYQKIRDEGLNHSHVMEFASALTDGIGGRLTGSPNMQKANEWTQKELAALGCVNAHTEDWGEFGMGWQQLNSWARMTSPDTAVFIVQAVPWSASTNGPVNGDAVMVTIKDEKDIDQYKGKLAGKIVLLGEMRDVGSVDQALFHRYDEKELQEIASFPLSTGAGPDQQARLKAFLDRQKLNIGIAKFLSDEKPLAVIRPSRDSEKHGGSGGTIFDDNGATIGRNPYEKQNAFPIPVVVAAIENYGRVARLLKANVPVKLEVNVENKFTGDHEHGFNTIAEIAGTDPKLKDEIVMVGGHLDSWAAGTGATDNGAGSIVAMEVMRILKALDVHPRRTIRIGLWSGEEQGLFGSRGYVKQHFGSAPPSEAPDQKELPAFLRKAGGPLELKPEWKTFDAYFNLDNGTGRIRGIYSQGNAAVEPIFEQWIAPLKDLGVSTMTMRNTGGTDHLSFDAVGLPGFQFIQDEMDYDARTHHSNMDTYERLQAADLKQAATVEAIFVYNAAMRDQMLPKKPLPRPELQDKLAAPLPGVMPGAVESEKK